MDLKLLCFSKIQSFQKNIQRNTIVLAQKYKLCDSMRHRPIYHDCIQTEKICASPLMTATDASVTGVTARPQNERHKVHMVK
jgi:hypothetical protein